MSLSICSEMQAWAKLLHLAAHLGVESAARRGVASDGFTEQVAAAAHCERIADALEERVAEDC